MPRHAERRVLPYTPEQMVDLVADIPEYPRFLPWCTGARIRSREGDDVLADLDIGYKVFQETFTSRVTLDRPRRISVDQLRGPFRKLANTWVFSPHGEAGCEVEFAIEFAFQSRLLNRMVGAVFERAFQKMVASFEERAAVVYAGPNQRIV